MNWKERGWEEWTGLLWLRKGTGGWLNHCATAVRLDMRMILK